MRKAMRRAAWTATASAVAGAAFLAVTGWLAYGHLNDARDRLPAVRAAVTSNDLPAARNELEVAREHTSAARRATSGPLWAAVSAIPWVGGSAHAARNLTAAADDVAGTALPALVQAAERMAPAEAGVDTGPVDLEHVRAAATPLAEADSLMRSVTSRTGEDRAGVAPALAQARADFHAEAVQLADLVSSASLGARLLPVVLGGDGPRRYFVMLQTNAESRGTGGFVGAYGVLEADAGRLTLPVIGDDRDFADLQPPPTDLGAEFDALYGGDARSWQNANLSPHFPYAARLWQDMWQRRTGEPLDGVIGLDLVALAHLLEAVGPVQLPSGGSVDAGNVVRLTGNEAYLRFVDDQAARKDFLGVTARTVVQAALDRAPQDPLAVLRALARSANERRLGFWSAHSAEQEAIAGSALSGELPEQAGPFVAAIVNNAAGNKIDYYLGRQLSYSVDRCQADHRTSTVVFRLHNGVPDQPLPSYVAGRVDVPQGTAPFGSTKLNVAVYTAVGAALAEAYVDGERVTVRAHEERGHPVFVLPLELGPRQTREIRLEMIEPPVATTPLVLVQPLVLDQITSIDDEGCPS